MLYKKITLPLLPFAGLLIVSSCDNGNQASVSVIPDNHKDSNSRKELQGSLDAYKALGSLSYEEGKQSSFLLQVKGRISSKNHQLTGQVGFVLLPSSGALKDDSPIMKNAIKVKDQNKKLIPQGEGVFVYWDKIGKITAGTVNHIIRLEEAAYKKLTSKKYQLCMVYAPSGAAGINEVVATIPMDLTGRDSSLPVYRGIGLKALDPTEKQLNDDQGWALKGAIGESFKAGAQVGFILVKDGVNPYGLVQQVIASENKWPTGITSFSGDMIMIPVDKLRDLDPPIIMDFPQNEAPIQGGKFNLHCYWTRNGHYYLSQVEDTSPPSITFTGSKHSLKVSALKLVREQLSGQVQNVKLSGGAVEYSVNGQAAEIPAGQQPALVVVKDDAVWRSSTLVDLRKKSLESNSNVSITDDRTICLIADVNKPLDQSCIDFFSKGTDYQYFACLFSTDDYKLKFYTQKQQVDIETTEVGKTAQPKEESKVDKLKITLDNTGANITVKYKTLVIFGSSGATYTLPKVNLEPSDFDTNNIPQRGFLITKNLEGGAAPTIANFSDKIQKFIDDSKGVDHDKSNQTVIFREDNQNDLKEILYDAYNSEKKGKYTLVIGYWAQYKDQIIWSEPVSIELK
ncbi:hypothetical protein [Cardinium endosymbiont of Philonthus spinipes]|uniref:hypothetical protein n=1 Tax=Cardinium endosymbiont of Philonthus spinipes TaxID=3077941 RepID=UPI00313B26C5